MEPAFAHWFGIRPWEMERLTDRQLERLVEWLQKQTKAMEGKGKA